jgi:hypothetical protein
MGFFNISMKFLIDKVPHHAVYWTFGTLAGLESSRPQAQMTIGLKLKTLLVLRPFQRALICLILIAGTIVIQENIYFSW